jgi:hypothetical protein
VEGKQGNCTDKENKIFLIYKEIQMGAVAKGFLMYEEMRKYLVMYCTTLRGLRRSLYDPSKLLDFLIHIWGKFGFLFLVFFFISDRGVERQYWAETIKSGGKTRELFQSPRAINVMIISSHEIKIWLCVVRSTYIRVIGTIILRRNDES